METPLRHSSHATDSTPAPAAPRRRQRELRLTPSSSSSVATVVDSASTAGRRPGDRVAYMAQRPSQLNRLRRAQVGESSCRSTIESSADDFAYIIDHSGEPSSAHRGKYLGNVESHSRPPSGVKHFIALSGQRDGWLDYEARSARNPRGQRSESPRALLTFKLRRCTRATKGVVDATATLLNVWNMAPPAPWASATVRAGYG